MKEQSVFNTTKLFCHFIFSFSFFILQPLHFLPINHRLPVLRRTLKKGIVWYIRRKESAVGQVKPAVLHPGGVVCAVSFPGRGIGRVLRAGELAPFPLRITYPLIRKRHFPPDMPRSRNKILQERVKTFGIRYGNRPSE